MFRTLFLRWWLLVAVIGALCAFAWHLGAFHEMYQADGTYMKFSTFGIYILFVFSSIWCGYKSWKLGNAMKKKEISLGDELEFKKEISQVRRNAEIGWFASDICLTLGMIGTVWGFYQMFQGESLAAIDVSNSKSMLSLIGQVARGMSTALSTTLIGLFASTLIKVQFFNLDHAIEGAADEEK